MGEYLSSFFHQPPFFGGMKMSAMGREKNRQSILEYTRQKNFYWGLNANPMLWATPG